MIESLTEGPEGAEKWYFIIFHNSPACAVARRGSWVVSLSKPGDPVWGSDTRVSSRFAGSEWGSEPCVSSRIIGLAVLGMTWPGLGYDLGMTWPGPGTLPGRGYIILLPSVLS